MVTYAHPDKQNMWNDTLLAGVLSDYLDSADNMLALRKSNNVINCFFPFAVVIA